MNHLHGPIHFGNKNFTERDEGSWISIVDLIFDIVRHQERLAIKRKALGRRKRKLAQRLKRGALA